MKSIAHNFVTNWQLLQCKTLFSVSFNISEQLKFLLLLIS